MPKELLFDAAQPIGVTLLSAGEQKKFSVRFPSDEEWIDRQRSRKLVTQDLGNGRSKRSVPDAESGDASLLKEIIQGESNGFDAYEAAAVIEQLEQAEVVGIDADAESKSFRVSLKVPGAVVTTHSLRMPTLKQLAVYSRNVTSFVDCRFGKSEMTVNLNVSAELYDEHRSGDPQGYVVADIPAIHKHAVVGAVAAECRQMQARAAENF